MLRYAGSRLERTVAAPDHKHMTAGVLLGINQPVNHFVLIFPFDFKFPRRANGEQNRGRSVRTMGGLGMRLRIA